jgi:hypothetical protein
MSKQHDVFLSYSRADTAIMVKVRDTLRSAGITVWTDENIEVGTPIWSKSIDDAMRDARSIVVLCSKTAHDSKWVRDEITTAESYQIPIYIFWIKDNELEAIPFGYRNNQRIDARGNGFEHGLERLKTTLIKKFGKPAPVQASPVPTPQPTPKAQTPVVQPSVVTTQPKPEPEKPVVSASKPTVNDTRSTSTPVSHYAYIGGISTAVHRLHDYNPLDWFRLLWWMLVKPKKLRAHQKAYGKNSHHSTNHWLSSTLICLPLFIPMSAALLINPAIIQDTSYLIGGKAEYQLLAIIGVWLILPFLMEWDWDTDNFWMWLVALLIGAGVGLSLGVGLGLVGGLGLGLVVGLREYFSEEIAMLIFWLSPPLFAGIGTFIETGNLGQAVLSGALVIFVIGILFLAVLLADQIEQYQSNWVTKTAFALIPLSYIFLIWMYYLGGWQHFAVIP